MVQLGLLDPLDQLVQFLVQWVQQDQWDHKAQLDQQVLQDYRVQWGLLALMGFLVQKDHLVQ
jgi:hypothetical protein